MHYMWLICKHEYNNVENELVEATIVCGHYILSCAFENDWIDKYDRKTSYILAWWSITMFLNVSEYA